MNCMNWIYEILFPRRCPVCLDIVLPKGDLICPECVGRMAYLEEPLCKRCGKKIDTDEAEYCSDCMHHKRSFEAGISLLRYTDPLVQRLLTRVKYHNARQLLDYPCQQLCRRYGAQIRSWNACGLVPVPLHAKKHRRRGYNQAEEIAVRIGSELQLPVLDHILIRTQATAPQKELNNTQRFVNLLQAFSAGEKASAYHTLILVDDIYTTGSTAEVCARVLKKAGVKQVYVITLSAGTGIAQRNEIRYFL